VKVWIAVLCVIALLLGAAPGEVAAEKPGLTVVLSAFSYQADDGTWLGESGPFFNAMGDAKVDVSAELPYCEKAFLGKIYGQPVLAVTMFSSKVPTAECAMNLVSSRFMQDTTEFIWSGISGFSPRVGGYAGSTGAPTVIGDVCVAYAAVDWDLTFSSMTKQTFWPMDWPSKTEYAIGDKALADELYQAALKVDWPALPPAPASNVAKYFGQDAVRLPRAWYGNCAEATGDNFWHSALDDQQARNKISVLFDKIGQPLPPEQIIAVTAMEQTGWGNVLEDAGEIRGRPISWAYIRSSSNYDQPWLLINGQEAVTGQASINEGMNLGGGDFGCITAALPVLKMLELRASE